MKRILIVLIALAAVAVVILSAGRTSVPNLFANSRRIPGYTTNGTIFLTRSWASPNEMVFPDAAYRGNSIQLNIETGQQTILPFGMQVLSSARGAGVFGAQSPDGRSRLAQVKGRWRLTDQRGNTIQDWPLWECVVLWDPKGGGWAGVDPGGRIVRLYRLGDPSPRLRRLSSGMVRPVWYDGGETIGFVTGQPTLFTSVAIVRLGDTPTTSTSPIRYPEGTTEALDFQASPDGKHIAWYLGRGKRSIGWMDRLLAYVKGWTSHSQGSGRYPPPMDAEGIWLSRPDGSDMRPVGEVKAEWSPEGMASFCWRPDGKSLLVTYRHGIYEVPIDR